MSRRRYIVAYDIRDPRRLRDVHDIVLSHGEPLQYSVFVCDLDDREVLMLKTELRDSMDLRRDSVMFVDLGEPATRGHECFEFMGSRRMLPPGDGGAMIV